MRRLNRALLVGAMILIPLRGGVAQTPTDSADAVAAFTDYLSACSSVGQHLWRRPLCGPIVGVDGSTGWSIATDSFPIGSMRAVGRLWIGRAPEGFGVANSTMQIGEQVYATVRLPLAGDRFERLRLMAHESFHRIQGDLGLNSPDRINGHLDEREGRVLLRLELRALGRALESTDAEATAAVSDALLFRARRHQLYPGADSLEASLERQEGLAEYTGTVVALAHTGLDASRVVKAMEDFERRPSYIRALGYGTGPALGLLLDRLAPGWRTTDVPEGLASALMRAAAFQPPADLAASVASRSAQYDGRTIMHEEDQRQRLQMQRSAEYTARLVEGPVLRLHAAPDLFRSFNPNTLFALGSHGTVYPTGVFTAGWGRLVVEHGGAALLHQGNTVVQVSLPGPVDPSRRTLDGVGWRLELTDGWQLVPGERTGDWMVAAQP